MKHFAEALSALRPGKPMYYNSGEPIDASKIVYESECDPISQEELDAKIAEFEAAEPIRLLRVERDKLLASSDWTGLADTALTDEVSAKWQLYRQKLRNLPGGLDTVDKVNAVTWPEKPE